MVIHPTVSRHSAEVNLYYRRISCTCVSLFNATCPECRERIQLNDEKEFGFCMNCGCRIEIAAVRPPEKKEVPAEPEIPAELKEVYEKAKAGDMNAQYELGNCYMTGKIVYQDFEQALIWLNKAAEQGEPFAMYNIGILYSCGHGVKQNCSIAQQWFTRANENGLVERINEAKAKQKSQ